MRAGSVVRDGRGRYGRCHSAAYVPGHGIWLHLGGSDWSLFTLLLRFMAEGGVVVRRP